MTPEQFVKQLEIHGNITATARACNIGRRVGRTLYIKAAAKGLVPEKPIHMGFKTKDELMPEELQEDFGSLEGLETHQHSVPKKGKIKRYIFTCAQNNTDVNENMWENILAFANYYDAEIHVSRFSYLKRGLGVRGDKAGFSGNKIDNGTGSTKDDIYWDSKLLPYISDEHRQIAPGLVWCGEMNTLPTAVRPLSGLDSYTGRSSGIFPHVKLAMNSVASGKNEPTKFNYTTGAVTLRNYIQRKAGLKAEFHHCYAALIVEVTSNGSWFVRQLNADSQGTIYDVDIFAEDGKIKKLLDHHKGVEAITWGDIHAVRVEPMVLDLGWYNDDSMMNILKPRKQFIHDVLDFRGRNHHDIKNMHERLARYAAGEDDVRQEVETTLDLLRNLSYPYDCETFVVDSNHDRAMERWLREADWQYDCVNIEFYLEAQLAKVRAILNQEENFHLLEWCAEQYLNNFPCIRFLREDESYVLCPDNHGGIEGGMHGHLGVNGGRGSAMGFAKMGRKSNVCHTHSAGIYDGVYTSGMSCQKDMGFNRGPGSWSWSHTVTYPNGKRAIYTMWDNMWRAK